MKHQKLTMQKLVDLKDKKVYDSIYIKCHLCGQFKPAKGGVIIESDMCVDVDFESKTTLFKQVCEVVCNDCLEHFPSGYRCSKEIPCDDCKDMPCELPDVIQ